VNVQRYIDLGSAALDFSRIERITFHQDGKRPETDSDHTVMLSWLACSFASEHLPRLDIGLVAQFAVIHDAVEVYAGDTPTLWLQTMAQKREKIAREQAAFRALKARFYSRTTNAGANWFVWAVEKYEEQTYPEARFVRGMDKLMPKVQHILNNGAVFRDQRMTTADLAARYDQQYHEMMMYCYDFEPLMEFRQELIEMVFNLCEEALK
jgi:5'-deoxynucleotidase YfbR-like HD superfamily hydrolase